MKKILKFLSLLLPLIIATAAVVAATAIAIGVYYQIYFCAGFFMRFVLNNKDITFMGLINHIPMISEGYIVNLTMLLPIVWVFIFGIWYWYLTNGETIKNIKVFTPKSIVVLLLLSVGYQVATTGFLDLILPYFEKLAEEYSELMKQLENANPWLTLFTVVILAPISEELIFRGVIMKKACRFTNFAVANFLQALLFGLFHMNIVQGVYAFAGGLAMGYVAYQYRTILASIVFHLFFNSISYVMLAPVTTLMKFTYLIGGTLIILFALYQVKKIGEKQRMPVETAL